MYKETPLTVAEEVVLQHAAEKLIALHGGDMLKALKAAMLHNGYLEGRSNRSPKQFRGSSISTTTALWLRTRRPDACREIIRPG